MCIKCSVSATAANTAPVAAIARAIAPAVASAVVVRFGVENSILTRLISLV